MRFFSTLCLLLIALGSTPAFADIADPDPQPEPAPDDGGSEGEDDAACSVGGFGLGDPAGYAPVLLGVMLLGAARRRDE